MKKVIVLSVFILFGLKLSAQEIIYKPVFIKQYNNYYRNHLWYLYNDEMKFVSYRKDSIVLDTLGEYILDIDNVYLDVNIQSYGVINDTFNIPKLVFKYIHSDKTYSEFTYCEETANGQIIDYFYNGNIRVKGNFENGMPADTMWVYYRTGELHSVFVKNDDNEYVKTVYYKSGKVKKLYSFKDNWENEFYLSGDLKSKLKLITNNSFLYLENYENGQIKERKTKNKLLQFYENGNLKTRVTTKNINVERKNPRNDIPNKYNRLYSYTSYDSASNKIAFVQYEGMENFGFYYFIYGISKIRPFSFRKVILYNEGKAYMKYDFEVVFEDEIYKTIMYVYKKEGGKWVKKETKEAEEIFDILTDQLNKPLSLIDVF